MTDSRGRRLALLVATDTYDDPALTKLTAPAPDALALADVLGDEMLGGFDVDILANATSWEIGERLDELLSDRRPDDVVFLHFACHGVKDADGQLHMAARNTRTRRLASTAVSAGLLRQLMTSSRAGVIVVMLDCCYGGAFSEGVRAQLGEDIDITNNFAQAGPSGRGRVVITASTATEYAFEGDELNEIGVRTASVFTNSLIHGIRSGEADRNGDGVIGIGELYEYLYDRVTQLRPEQTPSKWEIYVRGTLDIARSPRRRAVPTDLPPEIDGLLAHHQRPETRVFGVSGLINLVGSDDVQLAAAARLRLVELAGDDSAMVSRTARDGLARTGLRLSATNVDLGVLSPSHAGPPAEVRLLGGPLVSLSSVQADPALRARIDGDRLLIKAVTAEPGRLAASVLVTGPAGDAVLAVTGWVAAAPEPVLREAERLAHTVNEPVDRVVGLALLAWVQTLVGDPARAPRLLAEAGRATRAVPDSVTYALLELAVDLIGGQAGDRERGARVAESLAATVRIMVADPIVRTVLLGLTALFGAWSGDDAQTARVLAEARRAAADIGRPAVGRGLTMLVGWLEARLAGGPRSSVAEDIRAFIQSDVTNPLAKAVSLAGLVWATAERGGPAQMLQLAAEFDDWAGVLMPSAAVLAWAGGDVEVAALVTEARTAADEVPDAYDRVFAQAATALAASWTGDRATVAHALAAAESAASSAGTNPDDRVILTSALLVAESWTGGRGRTAERIQAGHTAAGEVANPGDRMFALSIVALAAGWTGHPEDVARILADAERVAGGAGEPAEVAWATLWVDIAGRLAGERERGPRIFDDLARVVLLGVSQAFGQSTLLSALAWVSAGAGGPRTLASAMSEAAGERMGILAALIGTLDATATAQLHAQARDVAQKIDDPFQRTAAHAIGALAEAWTGDRSSAYRTLSESGRVAGRITDPAQRMLGLVIVTVAGAWIGDDPRDSGRILQEAEGLAPTVTDPLRRDGLLLLVDAAGALIGVPRRAARIPGDLNTLITNGVEDLRVRAVLLATLAWLTSAAGEALLRHAGLPVGIRARLVQGLTDVIGAADTDELLRGSEAVAAEIADEYDRALTLTVLAFVYAQAGKPADALQILGDVQELARGAADDPYRKALVLILTACVGQAGGMPVDDLVREAGGRLRTLRESMRRTA